MLITLTNDFHRTRATVDIDPSRPISPRRIRDIRARLCGSDDCRCGESCLQTRGPQTEEALEFIARAKWVVCGA